MVVSTPAPMKLPCFEDKQLVVPWSIWAAFIGSLEMLSCSADISSAPAATPALADGKALATFRGTETVSAFYGFRGVSPRTFQPWIGGHPNIKTSLVTECEQPGVHEVIHSHMDLPFEFLKLVGMEVDPMIRVS